MLLDDIENTVDTQHAGLPERLYVLDVLGADGRVFFKSVAGSLGFDVEAWEAAIRRVVAQPPRQPLEADAGRLEPPEDRRGFGQVRPSAASRLSVTSSKRWK